jgi:hypothetical protein
MISEIVEYIRVQTFTPLKAVQPIFETFQFLKSHIHAYHGGSSYLSERVVLIH